MYETSDKNDNLKTSCITRDLVRSTQQINVSTVLIKGQYTHEDKVYVRPEPHYYSNRETGELEEIKWTCPICGKASRQRIHPDHYGKGRCCGVNLIWELEDMTNYKKY